MKRGYEECSTESFTDRTVDSRSSAPTVDYLALAMQSKTVQSKLVIKNVCEKVREKMKDDLVGLPSSDRDGFTTKLQANFPNLQSQEIHTLMDDTGILPP